MLLTMGVRRFALWLFAAYTVGVGCGMHLLPYVGGYLP
jgi:hypothetical protein